MSAERNVQIKEKALADQGEGVAPQEGTQLIESQNTGAAPGVNPDDVLRVHESNVIDFPPQCEGRHHPAGTGGHSGPATHIVTATCPRCAYFDVALMCAGRVEWIIARDGDFSCGTCGHSFHWSEGWTVSPLGGES